MPSVKWPRPGTRGIFPPGRLRAVTRAVLFDLFNTLTAGNDAGRAETTYAMGVALGVDPQKFVWEFARAWPDRMSGRLGDMPTQCRVIARRVGGDPTAAQCE